MSRSRVGKRHTEAVLPLSARLVLVPAGCVVCGTREAAPTTRASHFAVHRVRAQAQRVLAVPAATAAVARYQGQVTAVPTPLEAPALLPPVLTRLRRQDLLLHRGRPPVLHPRLRLLHQAVAQRRLLIEVRRAWILTAGVAAIDRRGTGCARLPVTSQCCPSAPPLVPAGQLRTTAQPRRPCGLCHRSSSSFTLPVTTHSLPTAAATTPPPTTRLWALKRCRRVPAVQATS